MGYVKHHAIIVTGWQYEGVMAARAKASEFDLMPTDMMPWRINEGWTFMCPPDGSKEGWAESDAGDVRRAAFKAWAKDQAVYDAGIYFDWVEVAFGGDDEEVRTETHKLTDAS